MTSPLVISCPASAALEDSYTTVDKDARKSDLHRLVLTLRRLETAHALSKELAEAVDYMDSDADLLGTRARLPFGFHDHTFTLHRDLRYIQNEGVQTDRNPLASFCCDDSVLS